MKRAVVFVLMGPTLLFAAFLIWRGVPDGFADVMFLTLFLTFPISAVSGVIDGCLARTLPFNLRAPLTAVAGATTTAGLLHILAGVLFQQWLLRPSEWMPLTAGAALCMGVFSFFSNKHFR